METCRVIFYPDNVEVEIPRGETLLFAAQKAGVYVNSLCGGEGVCGKCRLLVYWGDIEMPPTRLLTPDEIKHFYVLACTTKVMSDVSVGVPEDARLTEAQIVTRGREAELFLGEDELFGLEALERGLVYPCSPLCEKMHFTLPPPSLSDSISDLARVFREIRKTWDAPIMQTGLVNLRTLPRILRESDWKVTVVMGRRGGTIEILYLEPGDTSSRNYGVAIDVGTTSIAVSLTDLSKCTIVGTKAAGNAQAVYGADVISRIMHAGGPSGLIRMGQTVVEVINRLIKAICKEHDVSISDVTCAMAAGNTTMMHLLYQVPPGNIRREPYTPAVTSFPVIRAAEVGIAINPRGLMSSIQCVSSYVGGDITAGVIAAGICESDDISILMDIGTNGEVALGNHDWLVCSSCSAGPAFEGGGIKCGMRAIRGAIQKIQIDASRDDVIHDVIGGVPPLGVCGSALIDLLAELMRNGIVNRAGKFEHKGAMDARFQEIGGEWEFVLVPAAQTGTDHDIVITEIDIENLIRAKGAMYMGTHFLLQKVGMQFSDITNFYIAGGFGSYLNIENSVTIGLLPDIDRDKFDFIGNSSLTGARLALLSDAAYNKSREVAEMMTNFELSVEPGFMNEYTSTLFLPHTDTSAFPTVMEKLGWK